MTTSRFAVRTVTLIPSVREDGVIYVSRRHGTAIHNCACGCGNKVVTPLGPSGWQLDGGPRPTLTPSIGNWGFPCRSHYWIRHGDVVWSTKWTREQIEAGRRHDQAAVLDHYATPLQLFRRRVSVILELLRKRLRRSRSR